MVDFLKVHWKVLTASDFLSVEVWTGRGLVTYCLLFVISLADRVVNVVGITTRPDQSWMVQVARNETDAPGGSLHSRRYLIIDRDTKYSEQFRRLIRDNGTEVIRLPPRSPNLNAYAERFVRSIKDECLDRMIFVGQASSLRAVSEYMKHYRRERNHQDLDNRLIVPMTTLSNRRRSPAPRSTRRNTKFLLSQRGMIASFEFWTERASCSALRWVRFERGADVIC